MLTLNEFGICDWDNQVMRKVVIPDSIPGQTICQGVDRNLGPMSVVCRVSAAGESTTPLMVASFVNESVLEKLKTEEFRIARTRYENLDKRRI
jgi:hypothetical protein